MKYNEWRDELKNNLLSVTEDERSRVLAYYAEAYADRREAGFSEREIIEEFGAPYDAAQRILREVGDYCGAEQDVNSDKNGEVKHAVKQQRPANGTVQVSKEQPKSRKNHVWVAIVVPIVAVIVVLALVGLVVLLALNSWNLVERVDWESKTYECQATIETIDLDFSAGQLVVERYDGDVIKVDYSHCSRFTTEFVVTGHKLSISTSSVRWYNTFLWFNKIPTTTMYIPRDQVVNFDVEINAGHVTVDDGSFDNMHVELNAGAISFGEVSCNNCEIEVNAGALNVDRLSCAKFDCDVSAGSLNVSGLDCNIISVEVSAGSANLTVLGNKDDYTILTDVSAGSCNVRSQIGKQDPYKHITVEVSAGSANIHFQYPVAHN